MPSFALFEKSERAIRSFELFLKERKSDSLFGALFKRAKEQFALWRSFYKEQKNEALFVALFKRATKELTLLLFLKRPNIYNKKIKNSEFSRVGQSLFLEKSESLFFFFF